MSTDRIDKILCHEGFGTRKEVRKYFRSSQVIVNSKIVKDPSFHCDIDKDEISVCGKILDIQRNIYLMMNKPKNVVCANKDGLHETVFSLLDMQYRTGFALENLHLIGRLDLDTEGLLIFTTDGKLTHKLISPKSNFPKTYFVQLEQKLDSTLMQKYKEQLEKGIHIPSEDNDEETDCLPAKIQFTENPCEVLLTIVEGKYHQVKRMFRALKNKVIYLKRISMGRLFLDTSLKPGEYKKMTEQEIAFLGEN